MKPLYPPNRTSAVGRGFRTGATFLSALLALAARSQVVPTPADDPPAKKKSGLTLPDSEVVTLEPFSAVAEKDKGFMATVASGATKLGLDLNEMPAAYSVMTRELLDTLNITTLQDATSWAVSGAVAATDGTPNDSTSTPNRVFTQQRGNLNQTGQQRNFFLNAGIGDTYSAERIDFGRGPNQLLFNFGDINNPFAGGTSIQTKSARPDRPFETLSLNVGNWNRYRATADLNKPITQKAAVRLNLLWQDQDGWRIGAMDNRKGANLATSYRISPNTEVKLAGSYDKIQRTQTYADIFDQMSGWDGVTVVTGPISNAMAGGRSGTTPTFGTVANAHGQYLSSGGDVQGLARLGVRPVFIPGEGIMNWQNMGVTATGDANEYVPVYNNGRAFSRYDLWNADIANGLFTAALGPTPAQLQRFGLNSGNGGAPVYLNQTALTTDRFDRVTKGSQYRTPDRRFTVMPRHTPMLDESDRDLIFTLNHKIANNFFFQLQADANDMRARIFNQGSANRMRYAYIDVNEVLPNGQKNPHFLEVYSDDTNIAHRKYSVNNVGIRPNFSYSKNFNKWGDYVFVLGGSLQKRATRDRQWIDSLATDPDPRKWNASNVIAVREYWNNPIMPIDSLGATQYYTNTFDSTNNVTGSTTTNVTPQFVNNGGSDFFEKYTGITLAATGRYFHSEKLGGDHLIVTVGGGMVNNQTYRRDMMIRGDIPTTWDSKTMLFKPDAPSDWATLMYTPVGQSAPRLAQTRPRLAASDGVAARDPNYGQYRFRDDYNVPKRDDNTKNFTSGFVYRPLRWLSAKVNYSNSFTPPAAGTLDLSDMPAKPIEAYGWDYRLAFTPAGDAFILNVGHFYNFSKNNRGGSPIVNPVNALFNTRSYTDTNTNNGNSLGFTNITGSDYFTRNNTGYEFEAVGHPMRGLEITGSYGRFRNKDWQRYPLTKGYMDNHQDQFLKQLVAAGGKLDTTQQSAPSAPGLAVLDTSLALTGNQLTNAQNAVNAYNNIWTGYERVVEGLDNSNYGDWAQTYNTFIRYEIQSGWARHLRIGFGTTWKSEVVLGQTHSGDIVPNPNYDKTKAYNTNAGVVGADGRYTYKNANGTPTGFNAPYMPDPAVDQSKPLGVYSPALMNYTLTLGYSHTLSSGWRALNGKRISYNLTINNVFNRQRAEYINAVQRAPSADYYNQQWTRTITKAVLAGWQEPIGFNFNTTIQF